MLAILSDIHANLEALQAVVDDIKRRSIDQIFCLGDIVGYGPDPSECIEQCRGFQLCIAGNWDRFIAEPIREEEPKIERLSEQHKWTRSQLSSDQLQYLSGLEACHTQNELTFAHGNPVDHVNGYIFPEDIYNRERMNHIFDEFEGVFVCGHTHIPGVHTMAEYYEPSRIKNRFTPSGDSAIVNVGSVGQPRDNDPRACYVIYDGDSFEFVRLEYDSDTTRQKILGLGWLPPESDE